MPRSFGWLCLTATLAVACTDHSTVPDSRTSAEVVAPDIALDLRATAAPGFSFGPPLQAWSASAGVNDPTLRPTLVVCAGGSAVCDRGNAVAWFDMDAASRGSQPLRLGGNDETFEAGWDSSGLPAGSYRAVVRVLHIEIASEGFVLGTSGAGAASSGPVFAPGTVVPFQFTLPSSALSGAAGCQPGSGIVIDCDVIQVPTTAGGQARVFDNTGALAGQVTIAPGTASEDHVLVLEHRAVPPAGPPTLPVNDQIPFHLEVTAVGASGAPVVYSGPGAAIVLCQPASLDQTLPTALHDDLEVLKVNGPTLARLPTTPDAPECSLQAPSPNPTHEIAILHRLRSLPGAALRFLGPQPLRALHGGLNTSTGGFSGFTAILGPRGASSTASVSARGVGRSTAVTVRTRTGLALPFALGGDHVTMDVRGANPQSATLSDRGDGSYGASYVATQSGTDSIFSYLNGVPVGSGPVVVTQPPLPGVLHAVTALVLEEGTNAPIANARVVLEGSQRLELTTDARGIARFTDLDSGTWTALVMSVPAGYARAQPNTRVLVFGDESAEDVEVVFRSRRTGS